MKKLRPVVSSRFFLISILAFLFILDAFILWYASCRDYERTVDRTKLILAKTSISLEERVKRTVIATEAILSNRAQRIEEIGLKKTVASIKERKFFQKAAEELPDEGTLWLIDDKGNLVLDSTQYPSQPMNFAYRDYFAHQRDKDAQVYIGPLIQGKITGKYSFTISHRINGRNGKFLGIVLAAIETDTFTDFLRNIDIGKDSSVTVFRTDGALILRQPMQDEFLGKTFRHLPLFSISFDRSPFGTFRSDIIDGTARFLAYRKVPDLPILVVTGIPVDSVLLEWRERLAINSFLAGITFLVLSGLSLLAYRTTSREEKERNAQLASINESLHAEIAQHKEAEEALQHERDLLQTIMDSAGDAHIVYLDRDFNFVRVNETYAAGCGFRPEELIGKNHFTLFPNTENEAIFRRVRDTGEDFEVRDKPFEFPGHPERGITYWDWSLRAVKERDGDVTGLVYSLHDTTQRKRAEEELRKAHDELEMRVQERTTQLKEAYISLKREVEERERVQEALRQAHKMEAIGTLAGGIAHDFNNILAAILGFTEMAQEDVKDCPEAHRNLDRVLKSTMRARELVKQILAFARKTSHDRNPLSLSAVIKETISLLRASIPAMIDIRLSITAAGDTVIAAPVEIQQVLMNLAANASLAMERQGGTLEVTLSDIDIDSRFDMPGVYAGPGEYIQLAVSDTGIGMDADTMEKIFDPFFTTRDVGEGTGMGLSVVYGIVRDLNGTIAVESVPGKGSIFKVILPRAKTGAQAKPKNLSETVGGYENILFVDDEDMIVESGRATLERLGYKVTIAKSAEEALRLFSENPSLFDLVITDYAMPRIAGVQLAEEILIRRIDMPIILCTGYSEIISWEKALETGIRECLAKPFSREELANAVRRVLDGKER